jgi:hypothetical protein
MRRLGLLIAVSTMALASLPEPANAQAAQRSAQSDCTRELQRRGYTVISTGNFQQSKDGWQVDIGARDHRGSVTTGTCFVETRSGDVSLYGFGWGGSSAPNSFEFTCASKDERYRECQLPIDGRARLVKRKSDAPCIEGSTWGQKGDRVWVNRGCRATFEVVRGGGGGGGGGGGRTVECRSDGGRYRECEIPRGYGARLVDDYTSGRCRTPGSWGSRDGVLWVNYGCKGRFELTRSGGGGGGGVNPGQQQRAEVQCRNEAQRQYINVTRVAPAEPRGSYWFTTVDGTLRGQSVRADCRFSPSANRAELTVRGGGGGSGGSGGSAAVAERACLGEAQRRGLRVVDWDAARPVQGGYSMQLRLRQGNQNVRAAQCTYRNSNGQVDLRY